MQEVSIDVMLLSSAVRLLCSLVSFAVDGEVASALSDFENELIEVAVFSAAFFTAGLVRESADFWNFAASVEILADAPFGSEASVELIEERSVPKVVSEELIVLHACTLVCSLVTVLTAFPTAEHPLRRRTDTAVAAAREAIDLVFIALSTPDYWSLFGASLLARSLYFVSRRLRTGSPPRER